MEQNEEVVVKVYLEKERLWKEQLADLRQKLQVRPLFFRVFMNPFTVFSLS